MAPAPATAPAPQARNRPPARTTPPERHLTLPMRIALGFLHTGALYLEPNRVWRCRAFPQERVLDKTVRALETMGVCELREYAGQYGARRACQSLTAFGIALYARIGGKYADRRPPPVQAEGALRETEVALDEMAEQEARLARQIALIDAEKRETRAATRRIEASMARLEAQAQRFENERAKLSSTQRDLRAVTAQAAAYIGAAISETGA